MVREIDIAHREIGVNFKENGSAQVLLWAPLANVVELLLCKDGSTISLAQQGFGYWGVNTTLLRAGDEYQFRFYKGGELLLRADPASLSQPNGVHGCSRALNLQDFRWSSAHLPDIPLKNYIIYELHVGTFSEVGTFAEVAKKLDYLAKLGVTAIELMPVAQFPGDRNWGYDGVFPFAVQWSYGGATELQALVDACHQRGMAVILDVVYNHLGPEGNYLCDFGPYFTDKYQTPWGRALNFDDEYCDGVRHFFIENVLMWFRDFRIDALRLDAVHAIKDLGATHILAEIRGYVDRLNQRLGRSHHLIIECDLNNNRYINPLEKGGFGMDAQWSDEFHHALRVSAGQERSGYYGDFNGVAHLAKAYQDAYVYDGIYSSSRKRTFGTTTQGNDGEQFVVFSQNHDQVGNRMLGERSTELYGPQLQKVLVAAVFISPFVPLIFMGEEFAAESPFLYFVSHSDKELIKAVRKGRQAEFSAFHLKGHTPDPQDQVTFLRSKLQWDLLSESMHRQMFDFYMALIALRKQHPVLRQLNREKIKAHPFVKENCLTIYRWEEDHGLLCLLNFSDQTSTLELPWHLEGSWHKLLDSQDPIFGGQQAAPLIIHPEQPLSLQAQSITIYSNHE